MVLVWVLFKDLVLVPTVSVLNRKDVDDVMVSTATSSRPAPVVYIRHTKSRCFLFLYFDVK